MRTSRPAAILAALLLLPGVMPAEAQETPPRIIAVTGHAEVESAPDLATINAGVSSEAETADAALQATAAAMTDLLDAVAAAGIAPADVQTSQLTLEPVWADTRNTEGPGEAPQVVGYRAGNMVTLRVRAVGELGGVIDALGSAGANRLYGVTFSMADPRPGLDAARREAVADARATAELLAEAAGVTVGPVLSIRQGQPSQGPVPFAARAEMAMDMPVAEGSVATRADVEVVFAIE